MPLRRAGTVPHAGVRYGPGSAAHHAVKNGALRCVRGTKVCANRRSRKCECIPIPVPRTCLILTGSCPVRGASRGVTEVGQSESEPEGQPEGRCGARGHASQAWTRGALGNRPCPLRGAAFNGWTRRVKGGETCLDGELARARARKNRSQGRRSRRGGTLKGVAVCLCFSAIRETSRGRYLKVRLSAFRLPHFFEGGSLTHHSREGICGQR